jgi:hypothetical protein
LRPEPLTLAALVAEARAAEQAGDLPRAERAAFALRLAFGVSIAGPSRASWTPYRGT